MIGISTATFYPMDNLAALELICTMRPDCAEVFLNTLKETEDDYLLPLKRVADAAGVKIVAVHPYFSGFEHLLFFSEYAARLEDSIRLYQRFFYAAQTLGARYVVFHGNRRLGSCSAAEYFKRFAPVAQAAREFGVELLHENVAGMQCNSPSFIRELREASGDTVGFVFDCKQAAKEGLSGAEMLDAMAGRVCHVHLNDYVNAGSFSNGDCRLPFCGEGGIEGLVRKLFSHKYIGSFVLEVYRQNYANPGEIKAGLELMRRKIAQCGGNLS